MKRIFCLTLALLVMMMSAFALGTAAESVPAQSTSPDCIYFQVPTEPSVAWKNFSLVYCHIWSEGNDGGDFYAWQSKDERCTDMGNGYWSYDISGLEFKEDSVYAVIFSNENGMQTYNLSLTSACKGDIVYCDGETCVNPVDSSKQCTIARWMENNETVHPCAQVSSDGAIVDPDGVFNADIDRSWGNSEGVSINMPEVVVEKETQAPTEQETVAEDSETVAVSLWIILLGAVLLVAVAAVVIVVIVVASKKKM